MKVTSTIITKVAEATTENGSYNLEYSITDGVLERVQTTAFKPSTNEHRICNTVLQIIGAILCGSLCHREWLL